MNSQIRIIRILAGLVAGIGAAILLMMFAEALAHRILPPPAGPDVYAANDPQGPATGTLIGLLAGWFVAGLVGGWLSVRLSRERWTAWAVAGVILLSAGFLFVQVAHPVWMMLAGVAAPVLGAFVGQRLAPARRA